MRQNITPGIDMGRGSAPLVQQIQEVHVKKIGILGGMSAASTQMYYQTLCSLTQSELGGDWRCFTCRGEITGRRWGRVDRFGNKHDAQT